MFKKRAAFSFAAAVAFALTGCTGAQTSPAVSEAPTAASEDTAQVEGTDTLVLYSSHPTEMVDFFVQAFEEENPGVKVELITGGTGDLLGRINAEKGLPQGDVLWGGSASTGGSAPDLFAQYDSPVLSEINEGFLDSSGFNAPSGAFAMVIVYNKDLVSEDEAPRTWEDLADPKWKGKIQFANPESSSSAYTALVNWKLIGDFELVERMAANMIIVDSSSGPFNAVGNGEAEIGIAYEEGAYRWLESGNVGIVYPTDGVLLLPEGLFIIKDGPNSVNAKKFADFILSSEQQQALADNFPGRRPSSASVALGDGMPEPSSLNVLAYPTEEAASSKDEWLGLWREIIINIR